MMKTLSRFTLTTLALGSLATLWGGMLQSGHDYALAVTRPNNLFVVDLTQKTIANECKLPGSLPATAIVPSPDNQTAYIFTDAAESIEGYNIQTCEKVFKASMSTATTRGKSLCSLAVSPDNKHVYAIASQTLITADHYEVKEPLFMVFNTADKLDAKAVKTFPVPRQMTNMSTASNGLVYATGSQIFTIDPQKSEVKIAKKLIGWGKKGYSNPDSTATYPIGQTTGELTALYTVYKYKDKTQTPENADLLWGLTRVDLKTGKITQGEFAPYETTMFTAMTNPKNPSILYGVLTDLSMFDLKKQKLIKRVDVDHTYYSVALDADGKKLYLGSTLNDIAIYDASNLDKLGTIKLPAGDMGTTSIHVFRQP